MHARMSTTTPEEDPQIVVIQNVISHVGDRLHTIECVFKTRQDVQLKATEKLAEEVKQLRATVGDFTSGCFQLTFTPGRNRLLPQSFDYTLYRGEEFFSPALHAARHTFPRSTSLLSSPPPPFLSLRPLDGPALCTPSVLEALEKNKEVPKYTLSRKISTIPEMWREWTVGTIGCPSVEELDQRYGTRWRPEHKEQQFYRV